jgi:hypothetical protein
MEKKDIFDLLKSLEDKSQEIGGVFGDNSYLDDEISIIWAMIEDGYGITGMDTDKSADILSAYGLGEISKKKAQSKLKKLSPIHQ